MENARLKVRRIIELWALLGAVVAPTMSGYTAQLVAKHAPIVTGTIHYQRIPIATSYVLGWVEYLPKIGLVVAVVVVVAALALFRFTPNEDTRLQGTLVITVLSFTVALTLLVQVGFCLVALPGAFNGV
jgi:hypothetical protein